MALEDLVNVTITKATAVPSRVGFGTPLIASYHTRWVNQRVRAYTSLPALVADGFLTTDATYLAAQAAFSQNPKPTKVKVGRRVNAPQQVFDLTPSSTTNGDVYNVTVAGRLATYTVSGSPTLAAVCTAISAAITAALAVAPAVSNVTSTGASGTKVVVTMAANTIIAISGWNVAILAVKDQTADPGLAADLNAIVAEDFDWYGLGLDSNSKAEVVGAAAWCETQLKIFGYNTADTEVTSGGVVNDVMSTLTTSAYARTFGLYKQDSTMSFAAFAWLCHELPFDPGSRTWALKTLASIAADRLSATAQGVIETKKGNHYQTDAQINVTFPGVTHAGEYIDITVGIDWLTANMKVDVFAALVNAGKIPFTDPGIDAIKSVVDARLDKAVSQGVLAANPKPTSTFPTAASVSGADKAARLLSGVTFQGTLAGAIHKVTVNGTVSL